MHTPRIVSVARTCVRLALVALAATLSPSASAAPLELKTQGNQIVLKSTGEPVRLSGVNIPGLEWEPSETSSRLQTSLGVAADSWGANVVRLPVKGSRWLTETTYRSTVTTFVSAASARGIYVILDLHGYDFPTTQDTDFWTGAADEFKNHPAVLFGLFNEPAGTTLAEWRNGKNGGPGIQGLLNAVRATGANNVVLAGALDSAFKLRDIAEQGYTLTDVASGNGVVYDAHIYPWKGSPQYWVGTLMQTHPVLVGEIGHPSGTTFPNQTPFEADPTWVPKILDWLNTHNAHWTGWCMHPTANPVMISDWNYTPTAYWGAPAKTNLLSYRNPDSLRVLGGTVIGTTGHNGNATSGVLTDYKRGAVAPFGENLNNGEYYFDGPTPDNSWTGLDLRQAFRIHQIKYMPRQSQGVLMVGGVFQGANQPDFSDAVTLFTITQAPNDTRTLVQTISGKETVYTGVYTTATVANTGSYRYVRYVGPAGSRSNVAKIMFYGKGLFGARTTVDLILDNTDTARVSATAGWTASNTTPGYHGSNYLTTPSSPTGAARVRYTPDIPSTGPYEVFMRWTAQSNRASDVPVDIVTANGTVLLAVDQRTGGGQWNSLGVHMFAAGTAGYVEIANTVVDAADAGAVIADAVRFVASDGQPTPPAQIVLDSTDTAQVTRTGSWPASTTTGGFLGTNYLHDNNELKGTKSVTYAPVIATAAPYHVFLNWTGGANRSDAVVVEVASTVGTSTHQVNQKVNGGVWNYLGTFNFSAGSSGYVRIRNDNPAGNQTNNGYVIADGVLFEQAPPPIVMDNTDASGITITGAWTSATTTSGYVGSNYLHDDNTGKGTKSVRFTPTIATGGDYEIFARWTAGTNRADNVPVDIITAAGTTTVVVNQKLNGGQWRSLGVFTLNAGSASSVLIRTTGTNGYVIVDSIRLEARP